MMVLSTSLIGEIQVKIHSFGQDGHAHDQEPTLNINAHFIAPNPRTSFNPRSVSPTIDPTAYVGPFSTIIGDVTIRKNVFVAPNASIRADEGFPFYIDSNSNIQDGVILHGLAQGRVMNGSKEYSIYIGKQVSCTHGCIIHGPCKLGDNVFVGFHAIVYNAIVGDNCYISTNALVTGGVKLEANRFVPAGFIIDTQTKANRLGSVPTSDKEFAQEVKRINKAFPKAYSIMFGATKCSCGLTCDPSTVRAVLR